MLDVAENFLLAEVGAGEEIGRQEISLSTFDASQRVRQLQQVGAEVLICGAISRPMKLALDAAGIRVIPLMCGQVEEVLAAFAAGRLDSGDFAMPGCCRRRRQFGVSRRGAGRCCRNGRKGGNSGSQA